MNTTSLLSHPDLLDHGYLAHPESPTRLHSIVSEIQKSPYHKLLDISKSRLARVEDLLLVHSQLYIDHVLSLDGKNVDLDYETRLTTQSTKASRLAVGLCLEMIENVVNGRVINGFVLIRPPGHHAKPSAGMGYCVFNNIAIAAKYAISLGLKRVLILDWDVHHGNGTQETFFNDNNVFFIDLHQENLFPQNTGRSNEVGEGKGYGYTLNIPLPHSSDDLAYMEAVESIVIPTIKKYNPELILVSAGFDAHISDPMGSMNLSTNGYGLLMKKMKTIAEQVCYGKLILFLEGGYDPYFLSKNVLECIRVLAT